MLTLPISQKLIQDELQAGIVYSTYLNSPLLGLLPFEVIQGNSLAYVRENGLAAGGVTRAVNADYTEGTADFTRLTASLGRLGGKAQVDAYLQATGSAVNDQLQAQIAAKAKAVSIVFQDYFFNGDVAVDANGFDGITKLVTGTSQIDTPGTPGVLTLKDVDKALLSIDGDATAMFMNPNTFAKLNELARGSGMVAFNDINLVGSRVSTYGGVPVVLAGRKASGQILADGEIVVIRAGADGVHGIQSNLPSVSVFEPDASNPAYVARIDWYTGIALKNLGAAFKMKRALV